MDKIFWKDWYTLRKIKAHLESKIEAYEEDEDDIGDVDSFEDGILEGRK